MTVESEFLKFCWELVLNLAYSLFSEMFKDFVAELVNNSLRVWKLVTELGQDSLYKLCYKDDGTSGWIILNE